VKLTRVAHSVVLAWGWRRATIAFFAGAAAALPLLILGSRPAEMVAWLIPFVSFPAAVWLIDGAAGNRIHAVFAAGAAGWWFGFGYFLVSLYWVGNAFLVDARTFGWLLPIAVVALPAGLALWTALGFAVARLIWTPGPTRILALAVAVTAAEWLRGHLFSGFPWNTFGYLLASPLWLAQGAAVVGIWGLTFAAIAIYATPAVLADEKVETKQPWIVAGLATSAIVAMATFGAIRLGQNQTAFVSDVRLRIVQPNLQQDEKFNYSRKQQVLSRYIDLSNRSTDPNSTGTRGVTHLIWPESAFPFFLTREADALARIVALLEPNTVLITGGIRPPDVRPNASIRRAYNSIYVVGHDGSILSVYDKVHLVPFGEYLPFQGVLEQLGLRQLTKLRGGFIAGNRRLNQHAPGAPDFLPLVCYEIIFPGDAVPHAQRAGWAYEHVGRYVGWPFVSGSGERPAWMLNLTNDGWFGISAGPQQHFQQARMRAIEEGLPLVRAANTGISAVVDPFGRVITSLPLGTQGVLDASLPQSIAATPYARAGDGTLGAVLVIALVVVIWSRRTRH
jgi:apolipoprotein N-acyltransferase